ncbi:MAG TPA: hypothetical protein PK668_24745 [Myxococcota bacterium]|nr:hypothetical protein [Myxococcota bacterium]HRY96851.1 hypothetical protein [Myxococcota bacterium]HSA24387.1 hypothetical protein [Myxococcota bacterium]
MTAGVRYEVDLEAERVLYEGEWLRREDLSARIQRALAGLDFRVSGLGSALEYLGWALAAARPVQVRLMPEDAERLEQMSRRVNIDPRTLARHAVLAYLASQPALEPVPASAAGPAPAAVQPPAAARTAITTEPAAPGEEARAVPLTERKTTELPKVVVSPELGSGGASLRPAELEDTWFKKS